MTPPICPFAATYPVHPRGRTVSGNKKPDLFLSGNHSELPKQFPETCDPGLDQGTEYTTFSGLMLNWIDANHHCHP